MSFRCFYNGCCWIFSYNDRHAVLAANNKIFSLSVPPRITGHKEEEVSVIEGHMASLLCDVQAYPPPEITWTRDGQILRLSSGIHILPGQIMATCNTQII